MPKGLDGFWHLTPGMFGTATRPAEWSVEEEFGFANNHNCANPVLVAASWHNQAGEYLGRGDVSRTMLERVARIIHPSQVFIVTSAAFRSNGDVAPDRACACATFAVFGGHIYYVDAKGEFLNGEVANIHNMPSIALRPEVLGRQLGVVLV